MSKDTTKWVIVGLVLVALSACGMIITGGIMDKDVLIRTGSSILMGAGFLTFLLAMWFD